MGQTRGGNLRWILHDEDKTDAAMGHGPSRDSLADRVVAAATAVPTGVPVAWLGCGQCSRAARSNGRTHQADARRPPKAHCLAAAAGGVDEELAQRA